MMTRVPGALLLAAFAFTPALVGCTNGEPRSDVIGEIATYDPGQPGQPSDLGLVVGSFANEGGCVVIHGEDGGTIIPVFAEGATDLDAYRVGSRVELTGGAHDDLSSAYSIPAVCAALGLKYWLVTPPRA